MGRYGKICKNWSLKTNSIAIRLSRAFTKKELVIFCGYHGWSDWYLANNLSDKKVINIY